MSTESGWAAQAAWYREDLFQRTLPFWLEHAIDKEDGGYLSCLGREGDCYEGDKSGWVQGRFAWLLARLCLEPEASPEWRDAAQHGIQFIRDHGYCQDGRMWFQLDKSGRGLRKRRYAYTEFFASIAFAQWSKLSGDESADVESRRLFRLACEDMRGGRGPAKVEAIRPAQSLGTAMITLGVSHVLEDCLHDADVEAERVESLRRLRGEFLHADSGCLLECVGPHGEFLDHIDGRQVNPGHAIEAAWFMMEEHRRRPDDGLLADALRVLDAAWELGWDTVHGGLLSLVDINGAPQQEVSAELKYWWPHCEAIIACLFAGLLTGEQRHLDRWRLVHDWAHAHFGDPEHGEWYGYLRRDGSVMNSAKGNLWKGPFHIPRMQLLSSELCLALDEKERV